MALATQTLGRSCSGRLLLVRLLTLVTALLTVPVGVYGLNSIVTTSVHQLGGPAAMVDFLAFYTGAHQLITDPVHLYDPQASTALQTQLHQADEPLLEFFNPPHTAVLLAPVAGLPFGAAYLVWLAINLACLGGACWLLAPRVPGAGRWFRWAVALPLFLPVQLGLIMGQLSFVLLLGFAAFACVAPRRGSGRSALALLPWTCKPHLLPVLLLVLALARRWRTLALVGALAAGLCAVAACLAGASLVGRYLEVAIGASTLVSQAPEGNNLAAGHGLLGLTQWLVGPGLLANGLAGLGAVGVAALLVWAWRGGPREDARRSLQFALLPLAATLCAPHALAYDATTWLASACLALRYAADSPRARPVVWCLLLVGWWSGNLAAMPAFGILAPWGAFGGIVCLAGLAWLYGTAGHTRSVAVA